MWGQHGGHEVAGYERYAPRGPDTDPAAVCTADTHVRGHGAALLGESDLVRGTQSQKEGWHR